MGLLDEAIREHLELKRRRGADPSEVAREEHEALGPARRTEPIAPPADEAAASGTGAGGAYALGDAAAEPERPVAGAEPVETTEGRAGESSEEGPHVAVPFADADELDPGERRDDAARSGDDVLDQTPDFLEETPEHDRLWFEQRPPRDFDFDG
jgi:hypothetical protein